MTFEQEVPMLLASLRGSRNFFRFEEELLGAFSEGLLDTSKKEGTEEEAKLD